MLRSNSFFLFKFFFFWKKNHNIIQHRNSELKHKNKVCICWYKAISFLDYQNELFFNFLYIILDRRLSYMRVFSLWDFTCNLKISKRWLITILSLLVSSKTPKIVFCGVSIVSIRFSFICSVVSNKKWQCCIHRACGLVFPWKVHKK